MLRGFFSLQLDFLFLFQVAKNNSPHTLSTSFLTGSYLGKENLHVRIFDTPGFGYDNMNTFNGIREKLLESIKVVTLFAVLVNHVDTKFDVGIEDMFNTLHYGFGEDFWNHVVIIVTKYSFRRQRLPTDLTLKKKYTYLQMQYNVKEIPPIFYIDSFYEKDYIQEVHVFDHSTKELLKYVINRTNINFFVNNTKTTYSVNDYVLDLIKSLHPEHSMFVTYVGAALCMLLLVISVIVCIAKSRFCINLNWRESRRNVVAIIDNNFFFSDIE